MELVNTFNESNTSPMVRSRKASLMEDLQLDEYTKTFLEKKDTEPIVIGICGGPSSGKSFIIKWLKKEFLKSNIRVCVLKEKNFLKSVDI